MQLSNASLNKCYALASVAYSYIERVNSEWKEGHVVCNMWPCGFIKRDMALPWLGAVLPAVLHYILAQNGINAEKVVCATRCFALSLACCFEKKEVRRDAFVTNAEDFCSYFAVTHQAGEKALGIVPMADFLKKQSSANLEKVFACILLYAYMLGVYWIMRRIDADNAVSSPRQIVLSLRCESMTTRLKPLFDDFVNTMSFVDKEKNEAEGCDVEDTAAGYDFFENDGVIDDSDPEKCASVIAARAKYSEDKEFDEIKNTSSMSYYEADVVLRMVNDIWRYLIKFRLGMADEFKVLEADRWLPYIAMGVFESMRVADFVLLESDLNNVMLWIRRCLSYRCSSQQPSFFVTIEKHFSGFLMQQLMKDESEDGIPSFFEYFEKNVDDGVEDFEVWIRNRLSSIFKYVFKIESSWILKTFIKDKDSACCNCKLEEVKDFFEYMFSGINVNELSRIVYAAFHNFFRMAKTRRDGNKLEA